MCYNEDMLDQLFGSATRVKILQLFFNNEDQKFYSQEITKKLGTDVANTHRELVKLEKLGLLKSERQANQKYYYVNKEASSHQGLKLLLKETNQNFQKHDFFYDGTAPSALIYYYIPWLYAMKSIKDQGLVITQDGLASFWMSKAGATKYKNKWLESPTHKVEKEFQEWLKKWSKYDKEIFDIATSANTTSWEKDWERIDNLGKTLWLETYKLDSVDPFAQEFEKNIIEGLVTAGIDKKYIFELISPTEPTLVQKREAELLKLPPSQSAQTAYIRKHWYCLGTWNGGPNRGLRSNHAGGTNG